MLIRSDRSGMRVLSGLRASVESFPRWWACPTAAYSARDDSPTAEGGRSRCQYCSASLARDASRRVGSSLGPSPGVPCRASRAVDHTPTFSTAGAAGVSHVLRASLPACHGLRTPAALPTLAHTGGLGLPSVCVQTLGVRHKRLCEAVPALQGRGHPCG